MSRGLIGGSKGSEKSSLSFTFSAILALCIPRSGRQFEWVRCRTALALKFEAIVSYSELSGFLEWALSQSWQPLLFSFGPKTTARCSRPAIFEHNSYQKFSKWNG